jgi:ABC-type uncharacterized transport system permease subunit
MPSSGFYGQAGWLSGSVLTATGAAAVLLYLATAVVGWLELGRDSAAGRHAGRFGVSSATMPLAFAGHALVLGDAVFGLGGLRFGFAHALSATLLTTGILLWVEGLFVPLRGLYWLIAPIAAATVMLPALFPGVSLASEGSSLALKLHLSVAILAYSFLTVAVLNALLMAAVDHYLHQPAAAPGRGLGRLLGRLPPLLALESLLFRQIAVGFVLLSATLVSGLVFSEELFGRPLRFDHTSAHKIVFALLAWIVFGGLLAGRALLGWRGRIALRWTFTGFTMLVLAYIGSRFVLEVILRRTL